MCRVVTLWQSGRHGVSREACEQKGLEGDVCAEQEHVSEVLVADVDDRNGLGW